MSVLIKDMEMPRNCLECKIKAWEEGFNEYVCPFSGIICLSIGRQDDCPLVELEKHGRLIDADALFRDIEWNDIEDAPTVIEAEDEG